MPADFPIQVDEDEETVTGASQLPARLRAGEGSSLLSQQVRHSAWCLAAGGNQRCHPQPTCRAPPFPPPHVVAAGIPQRMLLDWLAEYRHCKQPQGWALPAQSWWTDQVGGRACWRAPRAAGEGGSELRGRAGRPAQLLPHRRQLALLHVLPTV